ncbi:uncharacterized protein BKA55DRAFT_528142, partial [Fusarium redolens]
IYILNRNKTKSNSFTIMPNKDLDYSGFLIPIIILVRIIITKVTFYFIFK